MSKVVDENGEPLVVYHGGQANINIFLNANENNNHKGTKAANYFNSDRVGIYFSKYKYVGESYAKKYNKANRNLYGVFLNIKTPKTVKYSETFKNRLIRFISFGIVSRPDVANIKAEELNTEYKGFDGINHDNGAELIVFNSNQVKSATDNVGTFSKTDNNIYHSLYYSDMIPYVIPFLRDSGIAHMWGGKLRLTKYNPAAKLQLENFCNTYGLYADIKDDGVIELYETDDKDEIREHVQDMKEVNQIIRFLQQRFPGLKARWVSDAEIKKVTGRSARACVKGDTVFLSY